MSVSPSIRLGTRGSQLALYQAHAVARLIAAAGGPTCEIVIIKTSGDRLQEAPLSEIGGKRLFVKEIEEALIGGAIDLAVHSSKDMPAVLPDGLTIAGVLPREDPHDAVVLPIRDQGSRLRSHDFAPSSGEAGRREGAEAVRPGNQVADIDALINVLGPTPSIGTSSVRRVAQLMRLVPRARFEAIRGNLDTRLRKLDEGREDALVLAAAGLRRLGFESRISFTLPVSACVPAPGQGIIAVETRTGDEQVRAAVRPITDAAAEAALTAERTLVEALGGGCQTPIGALASPIGAVELELVATVVSLDGRRAVRAHARGSIGDPAGLGSRVAEQLLREGAGRILEEASHAQASRSTVTPNP